MTDAGTLGSWWVLGTHDCCSQHLPDPWEFILSNISSEGTTLWEVGEHDLDKGVLLSVLQGRLVCHSEAQVESARHLPHPRTPHPHWLTAQVCASTH